MSDSRQSTPQERIRAFLETWVAHRHEGSESVIIISGAKLHASDLKEVLSEKGTTMPSIEDDSYPYRLHAGDIHDAKGRRVTIPGNVGVIQLLNTVVELRRELRSLRSSETATPRAWMNSEGLISQAPGGGYNRPLYDRR